MRDGRLGDIKGSDSLLPSLNVKLDHGLLLSQVALNCRVVLITCTCIQLAKSQPSNLQIIISPSSFTSMPTRPSFTRNEV